MTVPVSADIKARLADILAVILGVSREKITDSFSPENCETWDSVRHLRLVLAAEERFGIQFDETEIEHLTTLRALAEAVASRLTV